MKEAREGRHEGMGAWPRMSEKTRREQKGLAKTCPVSKSHSLEASSSKRKTLSEVITKETKARQRKVLN